MAGYTGTPLPQKLGIKPGLAAKLVHPPKGYEEFLDISLSVNPKNEAALYDWIQAFYTNRAELASEFDSLRDALKPAGQLWVSWPKKAAKVATDLDENIIREFGLAHGLVDVKVAAIDETWSGLKFVYRLQDR
jgi:hypothetical protein